MPLTLPIQIGKKYVCRDGAVITAQRCGFLDVAAFVNEKSVFPESGSVWVWLSNGRHYNENETHNNDLVADYIEPAVETVGHIHAALMALYAEDAAKTAQPWLLWQYRQGGQWEDCEYSLLWGESVEYRRKPVPTTKTVWVNLYSRIMSVGKMYNGIGYNTLEEADENAEVQRIACVKIEVLV